MKLIIEIILNFFWSRRETEIIFSLLIVVVVLQRGVMVQLTNYRFSERTCHSLRLFSTGNSFANIQSRSPIKNIGKITLPKDSRKYQHHEVSTDYQYLLTPVSVIKGVGPKTINQLLKLKIVSIADMLFHFPVSVIDRRLKAEPLSKLSIGAIVSVKVTVTGSKQGFNGAPHLFYCKDSMGTMLEIKYFTSNARWFYLSKIYMVNRVIIVSGKLDVSNYSNNFDMYPDFEIPVDECSDPQVVDSKCLLEPVYPLTQGLTNSKLRSIVDSIFVSLRSESSPQISHPMEWLDISYLQHLNPSWPTFLDSLEYIHYPNDTSLSNSSPARMRLAFDELTALFVHRETRKRETDDSRKILQVFDQNVMKRDINDSGIYSSSTKNAILNTESTKVTEGYYTKALLQILPYKLTKCQVSATEEIWMDLRSPQKMNRLIQGDVGSGKTLVTVLALLRVIEEGQQSAVLAPTEILAKQHYETIKGHFESINLLLNKSSKTPRKSLRVELLTGNVKGKARSALLSAVYSGEVSSTV